MAKALEMIGINKQFPGVNALDNVSFDLEEGEVHALVGENGAGKSTLMKILFGTYQKDSGQIKIREKVTEFKGPADSYHHGIRLIPQELNLVPTVSVMENIMCGRLPVNKLGFVNWKLLREKSKEIISELGLESLDLKKKGSELSTSEQQLVAIARAFQGSPTVLVFDEPTSALGRTETQKLFEMIKALKKKNVGIVYITHRLEEIPEIADRVTVMRDGKIVGTACNQDICLPWIIDQMTGMTEEERYPKIGGVAQPDVALEVKNLRWRARVRDVSFNVKKGEILGITGFVGAGKTEVVKLISGVIQPDAGEILINGKSVKVSGPKDGIRKGLALIPEDRRREGLVVSRCVCENITLPTLNRYSVKGLGAIKLKEEMKVTEQYIKSLSIVTPHTKQRVKYLSGGNQQKTVVAKWLNADAKIFIFDEGTRGIDVRAKSEIYRLVGELVKKGNSVIWVSMEFPEVIGMCDRILVMSDGKVEGNIPASDATIDKLYSAAGGNILQ